MKLQSNIVCFGALFLTTLSALASPPRIKRYRPKIPAHIKTPMPEVRNSNGSRPKPGEVIKRGNDIGRQIQRGTLTFSGAEKKLLPQEAKELYSESKGPILARKGELEAEYDRLDFEMGKTGFSSEEQYYQVLETYTSRVSDPEQYREIAEELGKKFDKFLNLLDAQYEVALEIAYLEIRFATLQSSFSDFAVNFFEGLLKSGTIDFGANPDLKEELDRTIEAANKIKELLQASNSEPDYMVITALSFGDLIEDNVEGNDANNMLALAMQSYSNNNASAASISAGSNAGSANALVVPPMENPVYPSSMAVPPMSYSAGMLSNPAVQ